jgi:replicative DNA helicase
MVVDVLTSIIPSEFQLEALGYLIRDREVANHFMDAIDEEYFENPVHRIVYRIAKTHFSHFLRPCSRVILEREMTQALRQAGKEIPVPLDYVWREIEKIYRVPLGEREYLIAKVSSYIIRAQLARVSEAAATEAARDGELNIRTFTESVNQVYNTLAGKIARHKAEYLLRDAEARVRENPAADKILTGLRHTDAILNGGLGPGELGVVLAPPGYGKSFYLNTVGAHAVKLQKTVLHVSLELAKRKVIARYEAHLTRVPKDRLHEESDRVINSLRRIRRLVTPGDVLVMEFPTRSLSLDELRSVITYVRTGQSFDIDLLIVDYADIMKMTVEYREAKRYEMLGALYERLRGLAQEFELPLWTGCQASRKSMSKDIVTIADMAESFAKAQIADVVIAICRTPTELREHIGRFYFAKVRDEEGHLIVPFRETFDIGKFEELEAEEPREAQPEDVEFASAEELAMGEEDLGG